MPWQYYHTVWFIMGFGWISLYLVRMAIAPLLGMIMAEFQISYATAGLLFSAILYSYTLMQIPSGYLGDRFGRRNILIFGTLAWFLLSLGTVLANTFALLFALRFVTGLAHGVYFGNDRPTVVAVTPPEKLAQGQGISFTGLALGFFLAVVLAGVIADIIGSWRWVFALFSIPSLITSFLVYKHIKEPGQSGPEAIPVKALSAYRTALGRRDLWLMYLAGFAMLYGYWVVATWMPAIYRDMGIQGVAAGSLLSGLLGLIGVPGLIISGRLSDAAVRKGYARKNAIALYLSVWTALTLAMGYAIQVQAPSVLITVLFLGSGLVVFGTWSPYYALLSELAPPQIVGTVFGLANFIGFLSAWVAPHFTGWIKDTTGSFAGGLYVAGAVLAVGTLLILAVGRPTRSQPAGP
ncbi:MAG: MFS transporter [Deltaproteobacteria bacterium]|nr:MFS transporter [Deltaproteobacteria bacterium]MBW1817613.1 MFS transporter [Deltaproteobacteria bacterium]